MKSHILFLISFVTIVIASGECSENNITSVHIMQLGWRILDDIRIWRGKVDYRTPPTTNQLRNEIFLGMMHYIEELSQERDPTLFPVLRNSIANEHIQIKLVELSQIKAAIDNIIEKMRKHQIDYINVLELQQNATFLRADSLTGYIDSLQLQLTGSIHNYIGFNNIYSTVKQHLDDNPLTFCALKKSEQQLFLELFETNTKYLLLTYLVKQGSLLLLTLNGNGNYINYAAVLENRITNVLQLTEEHFTRQILPNLNSEVWRCDPHKHELGVTYLEITKFQQGYITNEMHLHREGYCGKTCEDYNAVEKYEYNKSSFIKQYAKKEPCEGIVRNCQFIADHMDVCHSAATSSRRYEFISYLDKDGKNLRVGTASDTTPCSTQPHNIAMWWHWWSRCTYCFCLCDDEGVRAERFFNLREYTADLENNYVVTGLRFIKRNRIIHLQIEQGQLLPASSINSTSRIWRPVDNYTTTDDRIYEGADYHKITNEKRSIDLDDVVAPRGFLVTGIRLHQSANHLKLEARVTQYSYTTGILIANSSRWIKNDDSRNKRKAVSLNTFDINLNHKEKTMPTREKDRFVAFTHSNIYSDAAQTTIPYLDAQDVTTEPATPLSGVGLYYKSKEYYAGFIAPKIITSDFSRGFV